MELEKKDSSIIDEFDEPVTESSDMKIETDRINVKAVSGTSDTNIKRDSEYTVEVFSRISALIPDKTSEDDSAQI